MPKLGFSIYIHTYIHTYIYYIRDTYNTGLLCYRVTKTIESSPKPFIPFIRGWHSIGIGKLVITLVQF